MKLFLHRGWLAPVAAVVALIGAHHIHQGSSSRAGDEESGPGKYVAQVIARNLARPVGITAGRGRDLAGIYFSEIPEPGVMGGANGVLRMSLISGRVTQLNRGEPEPTNLAHSPNGTLYWTCKSAGVILARTTDGNVRPLLRDLAQPSGIALSPQGDALYFTEVPTPGVPGSEGGENRVSAYLFATGETYVLDRGDPEPADIAAAANGDLYWTCKSAGVIVRWDGATGKTSVVLRDLLQPNGIALDARGNNLYFTEIPTPGVGGDDGGENRVSVYNLRTGQTRVINDGDPEPTDVTVTRDGTVFWTCTSAGVIVRARLQP